MRDLYTNRLPTCVAPIPVPKFQTSPILAGRFEPLGGVGGHLSESGDHLLTNLIVLVDNLPPGVIQVIAGFVEGRFEFGEGEPGNPAECRTLAELLSQTKVIAVFAQGSVGLRDRREQRPAETVGQQSASRRSESDVGVFWKFDAKRLPVESPIENAEACRIHIYEDTA